MGQYISNKQLWGVALLYLIVGGVLGFLVGFISSSGILKSHYENIEATNVPLSDYLELERKYHACLLQCEGKVFISYEKRPSL